MKQHRFATTARIALIFCPLSLLLPGCGGAALAPATPPPPEVTVQNPEVRQVTDWLEFTGTTTARRAVDIRPRVSGYLTKVEFVEGTVVNEGDLLYEIDPRPYQATVDAAQATLDSRNAEQKLAEVVLQRVLEAFERGGTSELEVVDKTALRDQAVAAVAMARANLKNAQLDLGFTQVRAPFRGRIDKTNVNIGNLVGPSGSEPLTDVMQIQPIYAYFNLSEQDLVTLMAEQRSAGVELGERPRPKPVELAIGASNDYSLMGTFDFASNTIDPTTGTLLLRAEFSNEDLALLPGLFVRLRAQRGEPGPALLVPDLAMGFDQRGRFLYIVNAQNEVEYRPVQVGQLIDNTLRVIVNGIGETDRVVVNGLMRCRPGLTVNPIEAPANATEADQNADS